MKVEIQNGQQAYENILNLFLNQEDANKIKSYREILNCDCTKYWERYGAAETPVLLMGM